MKIFENQKKFPLFVLDGKVSNLNKDDLESYDLTISDVNSFRKNAILIYPDQQIDKIVNIADMSIAYPLYLETDELAILFVKDKSVLNQIIFDED